MSLSNLADLSQALTAPLIVASLIYAALQVRELRRQVGLEVKVHRLEAIQDYLSLIGDNEVREVRRWVLATFPKPCEPAQLKPDETERLLRLVVAYDRVGLLANNDLLALAPVQDWQGEEICRLWRLVEPVVREERRFPGRTRYAVHFEQLARRLAAEGGDD